MTIISIDTKKEFRLSVDTLKYTDYAKEEIKAYKLNKNKQKQMPIELESDDFCYSVDNYNDPQERQ